MQTWQIVSLVVGGLFLLAAGAVAVGYAAWWVFAFRQAVGLLKGTNDNLDVIASGIEDVKQELQNWRESIKDSEHELSVHSVQIQDRLLAIEKILSGVTEVAPDFTKSISRLSDVGDELKQGNKAMEGFIKLGQRTALEFAKLRLIQERFANLVLRPEQEKENAKHGFQVQTDDDANKESFIQEIMEQGYTREEAEILAQNQIGA